MNFISPELNIQLLKNLNNDTKCLHFKFREKFKVETSVSASKVWTNFLDEHPNEHVEFVWDCVGMTGFELEARKEWYEAMKNYKDRISKVYMISDKLMIRSAAKVMLQFFGIPSKIERSSESLPSLAQM